MNSIIIVLISSTVGIVVGLIVGLLTVYLLSKVRNPFQLKSSASSSKNGKPLNDNEINEIRVCLRNVENNISTNELRYKNWAKHWDSLLESCQKHKTVGQWQEGTPQFVIEPPSTEDEIAHIENILGQPIPDSFKHVLSTYSSKVNISWGLQSEDQPLEIFREIYSGECRWDLQELPELMETYRKWVDECFSDPSNLYDAVWHNKFPVAEVGNGDMIGIDTGEQFGAVIYLSHEGGEGHGYRLGNDFEDFINRIAQIGCVGYEYWQWLPFTSNKDSMINPQSKNAEDWRKWFGLEISTKDA